ARLAEREKADGEVLVLVGETELERGRREQALAAWAKVPLADRWFPRAALLRGTHSINVGKYNPAEEAITAALAQAGPADRIDLERALNRLYRFEGRLDDIRRLLRASWYRSPDPAGLLKELWQLDHSPMPVEAWQRALDVADDHDDRVWLGRANLAILTGRDTVAARWLDRAMGRRPDDPAVWRARLALARATGDAEGLRSAALHVPARMFDPGAI